MLYLSAGADMARGQRAALHRKSERGIVVPVPVFGFRVQSLGFGEISPKSYTISHTLNPELAQILRSETRTHIQYNTKT